MTHPASKVRLALDHNFPAPVLKAFAVMMPNVELVPIAEIDPALAEVDDWELFVALHRHQQQWDGLVTNDEALLSLPKEMTVLSQTHLTLVVAAGEGHNPIRAVGLLLCHLNHICHHTTPERSQVWKLTVSQKDYDEPRKYLEKIAEKKKQTVEELRRSAAGSRRRRDTDAYLPRAIRATGPTRSASAACRLPWSAMRGSRTEYRAGPVVSAASIPEPAARLACDA